MVDYHRFEQQYRASITRLWKSGLCSEDKTEIEQFVKACKSEGAGFARLNKLCQVLPKIGRDLKKPFSKLS